MPKKRTSAEANNDEQTNEGSDSVFQQQEDNAKRVKLTPLSDKTLQDLPIHLLKCILVKAVVMEVKGMKLVKRVWKEKADLVINRLKSVCLSWSSILTTNAFLTEVHRILDDTALETIRTEILHHSCFDFEVLGVTTIKEEIFMLCRKEDQTKVNVYDRNNMAEVKDVIALPDGKFPVDIEACNVSNCVYVLCVNMERKCPSVLRITKDEVHQFNILPWISDLRMPVSTISVSPNGMLSVPHGQDPVAVSNYDANGSLVSSADIYGFRNVDRVIPRSNGNLVLASINDDDLEGASSNDDDLERVLTEIDTNGKIQRQYISSLGAGSTANLTDMHGRIMITEPLKGMELLDCELNLVAIVNWPQGHIATLRTIHYNRERNEAMSVCDGDTDDSYLTIFRYTA